MTISKMLLGAAGLAMAAGLAQAGSHLADTSGKRIALSMRMDDQPGQQGGKRQGAPADRNTRRDMDRINAGTRGGNGGGGSGGNAFADAFAKAGLRGR